MHNSDGRSAKGWSDHRGHGRPHTDTSDSAHTQSSTEETILCGTLEKRSCWNTRWMTRYFVLHSGGELVYHRTQSDADAGASPLGALQIGLPNTTPEDTGWATETRVRAAAADADGRYIFEIEIPSRATEPCAKTKNDESKEENSRPGCTLGIACILLRPRGSAARSRTFVLAAPSAVTRARWIAALNTAACRWRDSGTVSGRRASLTRPSSAGSSSNSSLCSIVISRP